MKKTKEIYPQDPEAYCMFCGQKINPSTEHICIR